jgi:hypothetical protein
VLGQTLRVFVLLSAATLVACSSGGVQDHDVVTVNVSVDALKCSLMGHEVPCSDLPTHLAQSLKLPSSTSIILSDAKTGRTDNALSVLAQDLDKAGYSQVTVVGFITEPK